MRKFPRYCLYAAVPVLMAAGTAQAAPPGSERQGQPPGWKERGVASWYGAWHQGRRTSSGTRFDQNQLTAAHARLPLGSRVRVTKQATGESVVVTITDRQPVKKVRIIDLSRAAAARLGMIDEGTAQVTLSRPGGDPVEVAEAPEQRRRR